MGRKSEKLTAEKEESFREIMSQLPKVYPLYFKRPDSEKIFGIPSRVLEDLAMKKEGPPYFRRGKYSIYKVDTFEKWLTQNPIKTSNDHE
ncbi:MAG: hypothetical protein HOK41_07780 [Nitrospina sp.]|jgi:hypothetical protein|nr:hypothetical protein [Nitrospina sp.]